MGREGPSARGGSGAGNPSAYCIGQASRGAPDIATVLKPPPGNPTRVPRGGAPSPGLAWVWICPGILEF
ncbi:hypothetical protein AXF24_12330 [Streptococcus pneumoniae]|nr:hypothetical protein AXF24_12330 [Streptococcus pneumoniae]